MRTTSTFVGSLALARGRASGLAGALGILAGNTFYFALSATGVAAVIVASSQLFGALRWAGATYLVWLGLHMLVSRPRSGSGGGGLAGIGRPGADRRELPGGSGGASGVGALAVAGSFAAPWRAGPASLPLGRAATQSHGRWPEGRVVRWLKALGGS